MPDPSVRKALYVLFARLLAGPLDAAFYGRLRDEGFRSLAEAQGIDLSSDLLDEEDDGACASELEAEYDRIAYLVSFRESDYPGGSEDPVMALHGFLREHGLATGSDLPPDHIAIVFGIMGELADREQAGEDEEAPLRARAFFLRHVQPWAPRALTEIASNADRLFYRGVVAMIAAFLETERHLYP